MSEVRATLAGIVWKLLIKQDEKISEGQDLVILESMKMEIPISADSSGTIKDLRVSEGAFVNEGDIIAIID